MVRLKRAYGIVLLIAAGVSLICIVSVMMNINLSNKYGTDKTNAERIALIRASTSCKNAGQDRSTCETLKANVGDSTECSGEQCWIIHVSSDDKKYYSVITIGRAKSHNGIQILNYVECKSSPGLLNCTQ